MRFSSLEYGFFSALAWSADFLSMIFGIRGKFRIDIGENIFPRILFSRWKNFQKKVGVIFYGKFLKIFGKSQNYIRKSENFPYIILRFSENFQKIPTIFQNISLQLFFWKNFHLEKKFSKTCFHLCRSEIFHWFQKSYLENQPSKLKIRKIKNNIVLFKCLRSGSIATQVGETCV